MNSLTKYSANNRLVPAWDELFHPFEQHFSKVFSDFGSSFGDISTKSGYPKMDIVTADGHLIVKAALPGVDPDNIKVEVTPDNMLQISGKMEEEYRSPDGSEYHVRELKMSSFTRTVSLPEWANKDKDPDAVMKDGMLVLKWKMPEPAEAKETPRQITVRRE